MKKKLINYNTDPKNNRLHTRTATVVSVVIRVSIITRPRQSAINWFFFSLLSSRNRNEVMLTATLTQLNRVSYITHTTYRGTGWTGKPLGHGHIFCVIIKPTCLKSG